MLFWGTPPKVPGGRDSVIHPITLQFVLELFVVTRCVVDHGKHKQISVQKFTHFRHKLCFRVENRTKINVYLENNNIGSISRCSSIFLPSFNV